MLQLLIQSRIHDSIFSLVAVWSIAQLIGIRLKVEDLLIVPLLITAIYQWNRLTDYREDSINDPEDVQAALTMRRGITLFCFASFLVTILIAAIGGQRWTLFLIIFGIALGVLYSTPVIKFKKRVRLKEIILIKNISSAFGWALGIVLYPAWHAGYGVNLQLCFVFMYIFVGVFMIELIWDIRDLKGDEKAGIRTLPAMIGVPKTKVIIHLISLCSMISVLGGVLLGYLSFPWLLILFNVTLFSLWTHHLSDKLSVARLWSYILIYIQTILVFSIGITAMIFV